MAEWRFLRGWSSAAMRLRLEAAAHAPRNFDAMDDEMTAEAGWHHYYSEALIAREPEGDTLFARARAALANYRFSDPAIVTAHFDPETPLLDRRILLQIKVMGLRYLCPTLVARVREEPGAFGFRYDTLDGHIERGIEWFLLTKSDTGDIRFRVEARWMHGQLPNWWSRVGFALLARHYQRRWHLEAHRRMSLFAHYGSVRRPTGDRAGLTHQGLDVTFFYPPRPRQGP